MCQNEGMKRKCYIILYNIYYITKSCIKVMSERSCLGEGVRRKEALEDVREWFWSIYKLSKSIKVQ